MPALFLVYFWENLRLILSAKEVSCASDPRREMEQDGTGYCDGKVVVFFIWYMSPVMRV